MFSAQFALLALAAILAGATLGGIAIVATEPLDEELALM